MKPVLIDCDPGIDDGVALLAAVGCREVDLRAVTSVPGNVPADVGAWNARQVLELVSRSDIPVAQGAATPLKGPIPHDPFSHGEDGLGNTDLPPPATPLDPRPASQVILGAADEFGQDLTVVVLGPMTNLALALSEDPSLPDRIGPVVATGGMFHLNEYGPLHATGDNPTSEWNIYVDPHAAQQVINAGFDLTLVGLDISTAPGNTPDAELADRLLHNSTPATRFVGQVVEFVLQRDFPTYCAFIDPLTLACAVHPELFRKTALPVSVEVTGSLTRGMTVVDRRSKFRWDGIPLTKIVTAADYAGALDFLLEALETSIAVDAMPE